MGKARASFKLAYASSPESLGNMVRMSDPRLPARAIPGIKDKMAISAAIQIAFREFILFLQPVAPRLDSKCESKKKSFFRGYRFP